MPKVKAEYLEEKRNQILEAAFAVCNRKPAYDVTMSDIVAETGMSQGGVYKYFNNIDLVLAALIDKANTQVDYSDRIERIMRSDELPEDKLKDLFGISEQYFSDMLISYNKILFELSTFFAYSREKRERIYKNVTTSSAFEHLMGCAAGIIVSETEKGYFTPVIPVEDILAFITASYDGIIRDVTITKCYTGEGAPQADVRFDEKTLIRCLYQSTMMFLGKPRINEEKQQ